MPTFSSRLTALRISGTGLVAALGGGVACALLSMLTLTHPPATMAMGALAPLPLMIAALGFGPFAGTIAAVAGALFVALFDLKAGHLAFNALQSPGAAAIDVAMFLLSLGVPAALLGTAARQRAPMATTPRARPEERLLGRLAIVATVFATLSVSGALAVAISANGGLDAFEALLAKTFEKVWQLIAERRELPATIDARQVARQMTLLMPPFLSAAAVFFYLGNLWLAGRIAQVSELLGAPWPDLPRYMRVPRFVAALLAVSLPLGVIGGSIGFYARILSAALIAVLAIQGLAVLHALTRNRGSRVPLLLLTYLTFVVMTPWPLLLWGAVGLLDSFFSFRDRQRPVVIRKN